MKFVMKMPAKSKNMNVSFLLATVGLPLIDSGSWSFSSPRDSFLGRAYAGPDGIGLRGEVKPHTSYSVSLSPSGNFYLKVKALRFGFFPMASLTYLNHNTNEQGFDEMLRQLEKGGTTMQDALVGMLETELIHAKQKKDGANSISNGSPSKIVDRQVTELKYLVSVLRNGTFFNTTVESVYPTTTTEE